MRTPEGASMISAVILTEPPIRIEAGRGETVTNAINGTKLQLDDDGLAGTLNIQDGHGGTLRMAVSLPRNSLDMHQVELTIGTMVDVSLCLKDGEGIIIRNTR